MLALLNRAPLRLHPIDTVKSLRRGQTCLPPVPEFSELEGANLIDFHLLLLFFSSLACISQSPDGARLFCSLSVLTGSQLALDMSMSSLLESCWILGVSVYFFIDGADILGRETDYSGLIFHVSQVCRCSSDIWS